MKEKIQLLSRGVFEYENPEIEVLLWKLRRAATIRVRFN